MNEAERDLLQRHLDGELSAGEPERVAALLARDAGARAWVAEHRLVWEALGEACHDPVRAGLHADPVPPARFREQVLARTRRAWRLPGLAAAATLLVAAAAAWWLARPGERELVRHLHLLQDAAFLDAWGEQLDLQTDFEIWLAFDGEGEGR